MKKLAILFPLLLSGCALFGGGFEAVDNMGINAQKMDADKIKAAADLIKANKEKDTALRCVRVPTPYGVGSVVELNMDTAGKMRGKATVSPDCTMTVENDSLPPVK